MFSRTESQTCFLHFLIRQQPDQRLIGQISNLDAVSPWISEVATEVWVQFQLVLVDELAPHFVDLLSIPHHEAKMLDAVGLQFLDFKDRHELMRSKLAPGGAFTASQHFQSKDVGVKLDSLLRIGHLDHNMVAAVYLDHGLRSARPGVRL